RSKPGMAQAGLAAGRRGFLRQFSPLLLSLVSSTALAWLWLFHPDLACGPAEPVGSLRASEDPDRVAKAKAEAEQWRLKFAQAEAKALQSQRRVDGMQMRLQQMQEDLERAMEQRLLTPSGACAAPLRNLGSKDSFCADKPLQMGKTKDLAD
ncbi:unnamed protein product, partial [Effrenium voratum]